MGLIFSQDENISIPASSNENKISFQQVLNAFRRDIPSFLRHQQRPTSRTDSNNLRTKNHHRSHSVGDLSSRKNKQISKDSSPIRRPWQCQLCDNVNQIDSQLCSTCGSSKINVYIPIMNQNDKTKFVSHDQHESSNQNK
jgi:hypothetical protein